MDKEELEPIFRQLQVNPDTETLVSSWPKWEDTDANPEEIRGMRGVVFAVVPGEGTARQKLHTFVHHLWEGWENESSD